MISFFRLKLEFLLIGILLLADVVDATVRWDCADLKDLTSVSIAQTHFINLLAPRIMS